MLTLTVVPKNLFFTGKGGVGKTSLSGSFALFLADAGRRVLLVSTDPASNLDEILGVTLGPEPIRITGTDRLWAMNINPEVAAREYRERTVAPFRGLLPEASIRSIEEQLSGACTTEIASFEAFARLLGDEEVHGRYDHVVFDTAPTGHTLRLLKLPAAWDDYLANNLGGNSCLGPLAGLQAQKRLFRTTMLAIADSRQTGIVLVARPDRASLREADRTRGELGALGVTNLRLAVNGIYDQASRTDPLASSLADRARQALADMPEGLRMLPVDRFPLAGFDLLGVEALRSFAHRRPVPPETPPTARESGPADLASLEDLIDELAGQSPGVIMTMGKGGVGKTSIATAIAVSLAGRGHRVHLTTTDPAAHPDRSLETVVPGLRVSHLDAEAEARQHREEVLRTSGATLDQHGRDLLEEDLRSPCTEEIAVFQAFSRIVAEGREGFVVLDTAPTGHTLLLLDAAEAFHREVTRTARQAPEAIRLLRGRLQDGAFTKVLIVTLPEATPVHEAAYLQADLERAGIKPYAWVINQSLTPCPITDPFLQTRRSREARYLSEVRESLSEKVVLVPWNPGGIMASTTPGIASPGDHDPPPA